MKKKALVVTIFSVPNYGSVLQAYATQKVVESLGFECWMLNYDHNESKWAKDHGVFGLSLKTKIGILLGIKDTHRKWKMLRRFTSKHFKLTKPYRLLSEIKKAEGDKYDVYISGSDQIWNTNYTNCDPVFLLQFADSDKSRISLASSFACKTLNPVYVDKFRQELTRFDALSVREAHGLKILEKLGCKNAKLMLDPTLLITKQQWNELRIKHERKDKYILLYLLRYAFEPCPYVYDVLRYYKEKLHCNIIALEGYDHTEKQMKDLEIINATETSIPDFLDLFANASLVVTSSFHGTAFALNYGVPLISITPNSGDDRQSSLLSLLGLQQCRLRVGEDIDNANPFYDASKEQQCLTDLRNDALTWVSCVLNNNRKDIL